MNDHRQRLLLVCSVQFSSGHSSTNSSQKLSA